MARVVSVAACQFELKEIDNFDQFTDHVKKLLNKARGADIVVFPELFTLELFTTYPDWRKAPVTEFTRIHEFTTPIRVFFAEEAKMRNQYIAAGSHLVKEGDKFYNVAYLFTPNGSMYTHAKTHIFPDEAKWSTSEGSMMDVISLPLGKIGFNICYELEIPECATALAEKGVEMIICPSFTFSSHGFWRVRHCGHARAIENQVYIVHCCTVGRVGEPLPYGRGRSSILSPCDSPWAPNGIVIEAEPDVESVVMVTVNLDLLHVNRKNGAAPTFRDRHRQRKLYRQWRLATE